MKKTNVELKKLKALPESALYEMTRDKQGNEMTVIEFLKVVGDKPHSYLNRGRKRVNDMSPEELAQYKKMRDKRHRKNSTTKKVSVSKKERLVATKVFVEEMKFNKKEKRRLFQDIYMGEVSFDEAYLISRTSYINDRGEPRERTRRVPLREIPANQLKTIIYTLTNKELRKLAYRMVCDALGVDMHVREGTQEGQKPARSKSSQGVIGVISDHS